VGTDPDPFGHSSITGGEGVGNVEVQIGERLSPDPGPFRYALMIKENLMKSEIFVHGPGCPGRHESLLISAIHGVDHLIDKR
jgi:hypothetical protein